LLKKERLSESFESLRDETESVESSLSGIGSRCSLDEVENVAKELGR